ncbi:hypothetical protein C4569_02190 [Candidatus Parcubacteria bacterium]|nr:MAG: hypothetical protein C4569_02190 [Candidatus Parcubacteria bacterium]
MLKEGILQGDLFYKEDTNVKKRTGIRAESDFTDPSSAGLPNEEPNVPELVVGEFYRYEQLPEGSVFALPGESGFYFKLNDDFFVQTELKTELDYMEPVPEKKIWKGVGVAQKVNEETKKTMVGLVELP